MYLEIIVSIFQRHEISKLPEVKLEKFNRSDRHPISEGLNFYGPNFAGEIFFYNCSSKPYFEMEILIGNEGLYLSEVHYTEEEVIIEPIISQFLTQGFEKISSI
jgi:hypothetical protein